jgi:hypothetical protein
MTGKTSFDLTGQGRLDNAIATEVTEVPAAASQRYIYR